MFVRALMSQAFGETPFLEQVLREKVVLTQQPMAPACTPHAGAIHSIVTMGSTLYVASEGALTVVGAERSAQTTVERRSVFVRRHPAESLLLIRGRVLELCGADLAPLGELRQLGVQDAGFFGEASVAAVRRGDWSLFDVRGGGLVGGGSEGGMSVAVAGSDVLLGGESLRAIDTRVFRKKWEVSAAGRVVGIGGGCLVCGRRTVGVGEDGRERWRREEMWGCATTAEGGAFMVVGSGADVKVVLAESGAEVARLAATHHGVVTSVWWDRDRLELVSGDDEGVVMAWDGWNREATTDEWD